MMLAIGCTLAGLFFGMAIAVNLDNYFNPHKRGEGGHVYCGACNACRECKRELDRRVA